MNNYNDSTFKIIKDTVDYMITSIIQNNKKETCIKLVEEQLYHFNNLIHETLYNNIRDKLKKYEIPRYITICSLIQLFVTKFISNTIDTSIRNRLKSMYFRLYKKSIYYKKYRTFINTLYINNVNIKQCISPLIINLLNKISSYMQIQLKFINNILIKRDIFYVISKTTLDDFLCKIIFICTLLVNFRQELV